MEMICINCPMGCELTIQKQGEAYVVTGNQCKRGINYAIDEWTAPTRMVTSSVYTNNGEYPVVPVKTSEAIPKEKIFEVLQVLKQLRCDAPIHSGDLLIENVLGLDVNIIATKHIKRVSL